MSSISRDEVAHLARLSRLSLTDDELNEFADQIDGIIEHVQKVSNVDTEGVEPMSHPSDLAGVMREDEVHPTLTAEQALDPAPASQRAGLEVRRSLGE